MKPEGFFALNVTLLKWSGIYPPQTSSKIKNVLIWVYNITSVLYAMIFFTIAQLSALRYTVTNVDDLMQNVNMSASFLLTLYKVAVWWRHHKELMATMDVLQATTKRFTKVGRFDPEFAIEVDRRPKDRLTLMFLTVGFCVTSSACVVPLVDLFNATRHARSLEDLKLAYPSWVPFDYRTSGLTFCAGVAYQTVALLTCGVQVVGFDMLLYSLVCFASTHFQLLRGAFTTIKERALAKTGSCLQERMYDELRSCIQHLQLILRICERLEAMFNVLILIQTLISLVVYCTCLYRISMIDISNNIPGNEISYMTGTGIQFALYCYAGNLLTSRAAKVINSLYNSDWIITPSTSYRRNMILTMMRMNKPVVLTAGKFAAMTLPLFVTVARGSYSLFAFVKNTK